MNNLLYCAMTMSIYIIMTRIYSIKKISILNPLLWSTLIILVMFQNGIDYAEYQRGTMVIDTFIGPVTVVLAVPIYRNRSVIVRHIGPIFIGTLLAIVLSFISIAILSRYFELPNDIYKSLVSKSVTTPIGIAIAQQIGGIGPISVVSIIVTGIVGAVISPSILNALKIKNPVAKGIGIGASSHVIGTTKAIEMGGVEGAMSGVSLVLTGVLTYIFISVLSTFGWI